MTNNINQLLIYLVPLGYIALVVYFSLSLEFFQIVAVAFLFFLGWYVGDVVNQELIVKKRSGNMQYNRHPLILATWAIALVIRIYVNLFYRIEIAVFVMTAILALSTGMIFSESTFLHDKVMKIRMRTRKLRSRST